MGSGGADFLNFALFSLLLAANSEGICEKDWFAAPGGNCLQISTLALNFDQSQQLCAALSARTVHISELDTYQTAIQQLSSSGQHDANLQLFVADGAFRESPNLLSVFDIGGNLLSEAESLATECACIKNESNTFVKQARCYCPTAQPVLCVRKASEEFASNCHLPIGITERRLGSSDENVFTQFIPANSEKNVALFESRSTSTQLCKVKLDLGSLFDLTKMALMRSAYYTSRPVQVRLFYSADGNLWRQFKGASILNDTITQEKLSEYLFLVDFQTTIRARYLVLDSSANSEGCGMRFELYGCKQSTTPTPVAWLNVTGAIQVDTTWTAQQSPILLKGSTTVPTGVTLTIEAGTQVVAGSGAELSVFGRLKAKGNANGLPVTFSPLTDYMAVEKWAGIRLGGTASADLTNTLITGAEIAIETSDAAQIAQCDGVSVYDCTTGFHLQAPFDKLDVNNFIGHRITEQAVRIDGNGHISFKDSQFSASKTGIQCNSMQGRLDLINTQFSIHKEYAVYAEPKVGAWHLHVRESSFLNDVSAIFLQQKLRSQSGEIQTKIDIQNSEFLGTLNYHLHLDGDCYGCPSHPNATVDLKFSGNTVRGSRYFRIDVPLLLNFKAQLDDNVFVDIYDLFLTTESDQRDGGGEHKSFRLKGNTFTNCGHVKLKLRGAAASQPEPHVTVADNKFLGGSNTPHNVISIDTDGPATGSVSGNEFIQVRARLAIVWLNQHNVTFTRNGFKNAVAGKYLHFDAGRTRPLKWYTAVENNWNSTDPFEIRSRINDFHTSDKRQPVAFSPYLTGSGSVQGSDDDNYFLQSDGRSIGILRQDASIPSGTSSVVGNIYVSPETKLVFAKSTHVEMCENCKIVVDGDFDSLDSLNFTSTTHKSGSKRWIGVQYLEDAQRNAIIKDSTFSDCTECIQVAKSSSLSIENVEINSCEKSLIILDNGNMTTTLTKLKVGTCDSGVYIKPAVDAYSSSSVRFEACEIQSHSLGLNLEANGLGNLSVEIGNSRFHQYQQGIHLSVATPYYSSCESHNFYVNMHLKNVTITTTRYYDGLRHSFATYRGCGLFQTSVEDCSFVNTGTSGHAIYASSRSDSHDYQKHHLSIRRTNFVPPQTSSNTYQVLAEALTGLQLEDNELTNATVSVNFISSADQCKIAGNQFDGSHTTSGSRSVLLLKSSSFSPICDVSGNTFSRSSAAVIGLQKMTATLHENAFIGNDPASCLLYFLQWPSEQRAEAVDATRNYWGPNAAGFRSQICDQELNGDAPPVRFSPFYSSPERNELVEMDDSFAVRDGTVSGVVRDDQRIQRSDTPYSVSGILTVQDGGVLTIDPGVTLLFEAKGGIVVDSGRLVAVGTSDDQIHMRAAESVEFWNGINLHEKLTEMETIRPDFLTTYNEFVPYFYSGGSFHQLCYRDDAVLADLVCGKLSAGSQTAKSQGKDWVSSDGLQIICPANATSLSSCAKSIQSCYSMTITCEKPPQLALKTMQLAHVNISYAKVAIQAEGVKLNLRNAVIQNGQQGFQYKSLANTEETFAEISILNMASTALFLRANKPISDNTTFINFDHLTCNESSLGVNLVGHGQVRIVNANIKSQKPIELSLSGGAFELSAAVVHGSPTAMTWSFTENPSRLTVRGCRFTGHYEYNAVLTLNLKETQATLVNNGFVGITSYHVVQIASATNSELTLLSNQFTDSNYRYSVVTTTSRCVYSKIVLKKNEFRALRSTYTSSVALLSFNINCPVELTGNEFEDIQAVHANGRLVNVGSTQREFSFNDNALKNIVLDHLLVSSSAYSLTQIENNEFDNITVHNVWLIESLSSGSFTGNTMTSMTAECMIRTMENFKMDALPITASDNSWNSLTSVPGIAAVVCDFHQDFNKRPVNFYSGMSGLNGILAAGKRFDFADVDLKTDYSILVPPNTTISITGRSTLTICNRCGILVLGSLLINGNEDQKILVQTENASHSWAGIKYYATAKDTFIANVKFSRMSQGMFFWNKNVSLHSVEIAHVKQCFKLEEVQTFELKTSQFYNVSKVVQLGGKPGRVLLVDNTCTSCGQFFVYERTYDVAVEQKIQISRNIFNQPYISTVSAHETPFIHYQMQHTNWNRPSSSIIIANNEFSDLQLNQQCLKVHAYYADNTINVSMIENSFTNLRGPVLMVEKYNGHANGPLLINFHENAVSESDHGSSAAVWVQSSQTTVAPLTFTATRNTFVSNAGTGAVNITHQGERNDYFISTIEQNVFLTNDYHVGCVATETENVRLEENVFSNNIGTIYDLLVTDRSLADKLINATNNWWGTSELQKIRHRILDGRDITGRSIVTFEPFKTDSGASCTNVANCNGRGACIGPDICKCIPGYRGDDCSAYACDNQCYGNGECVGPNECQCHSGWLGPQCLTPVCDTSCSSHGICVRPNECSCYPGFAGLQCDTCARGRWGANCDLCPSCVHGTCDSGTGECICSSDKWAGQLCERCAEGYIGDNCEKIPFVQSAIPTSGSDLGGTLVSISGYNFFNNGSYECQFGSEKSSATRISSERIQCHSPKHATGPTELSVLHNNVPIFAAEMLKFTFFATCGENSCGAEQDEEHGFCSFGNCICKSMWHGPNCGQTTVVPSFTVDTVDKIVENTQYFAAISLNKGTEPVQWFLKRSPARAQFNSTGPTITWLAESHETSVEFSLVASNKAGTFGHDWVVDIAPSYTVSLDIIVPSGIFPFPQVVTIKGSGTMAPGADPLEGAPVLVKVKRESDNKESILHDGWIDFSFDSKFQVSYVPSRDDVGKFTAVAMHPQETSSSNELSWDVMGIAFDTTRFTLKEFVADLKAEYSLPKLKNIGSVAVRNVKATIVTPLGDWIDGFEVASPSMAGDLLTTELKPGESVEMIMRIAASKPLRASIVIEVMTSEETATYLTVARERRAHKLKPDAQLTRRPISDAQKFSRPKGDAQPFTPNWRRPKVRNRTVVLDIGRKTSSLSLKPTSLSGTIVRGDVKVFGIDFTNDGTATAAGIVIDTPDGFSVVNQGVTDLPPGNESRFSLAVSMPRDAPIGRTYGSVVIRSDDSSSTLPYNLLVTSDNRLDFTVRVEDEYTYFAPDKPLVKDASVKLWNTNGLFRDTKTTTENGQVVFENITESYYNLLITAENHTSWKAVIFITPAEPNQTVFLSRQAVTVRFSVRKTPVEDEYDIQLESSFVTQVPMPVVTVEPLVIPLLPLEQGREKSVTFTVTNHGLIAAEEVQLYSPVGHLSLDFAQVAMIERLPANTTISVVMAVTRKARSKRAGGDCSYPYSFGFCYDCDGKKCKNISGVASRSCSSPGGFTSCSGCGYRGGGSSGGNWDWDYRGTSWDVPDIEFPLSCDCLLNTLKCYLSVRKGIRGQIIKVVKKCKSAVCSCASDVAGAMGHSPAGVKSKCECATQVLICGSSKTIGAIYKNCKKMWKSCSGAKRKRRSIGQFDNPLIEAARRAKRAAAAEPTSMGSSASFSVAERLFDGMMGNMHLYQSAMLVFNETFDFEDTPFLTSGLAPTTEDFATNERLVQKLTQMGFKALNNPGTWQDVFWASVADHSEMGIQVSDAEKTSLMRAASQYDILVEMDGFVDRWNETMHNWHRGISEPGTEPGTTNTISTDWLNTLRDEVVARHETALEMGYDSVIGYYQAEERNAQVHIEDNGQDQGVCAVVRLRISQRAVMTRDAFTARLELDNEQSAALENVQVIIQVWKKDDLLEESQNHLFGIGSAKAEGSLTQVDGSGSLSGLSNGAAEWLIIPRPEAVPDGEVQFSIGGILSYSINGLPSEIYLTPDVIVVKAQPQLFIHYFHEKYVYGDDPMTADVQEEVVPFDLAVVIHNLGNGTANDLKITSAQPKIIENEKGLLIAFKIIGAQVGNKPVTPSLTVDFGDVEAKGIEIARWILTSSLSGEFFDFNATFENVNPLGDPTLSLVEAVDYHELIRIVKSNTPTDFEGDFLYKTTPTAISPSPYRVYNVTTGEQLLVQELLVESVRRLGTEIVDVKLETRLNETDQNRTAGWVIAKAKIVSGLPLARSLVAIALSNEIGDRLPLENAWITHSTQAEEPWVSVFEYFEPEKRPNCCEYAMKFGDSDLIQTTTSTVKPGQFTSESAETSTQAGDGSTGGVTRGPTTDSEVSTQGFETTLGGETTSSSVDDIDAEVTTEETIPTTTNLGGGGSTEIGTASSAYSPSVLTSAADSTLSTSTTYNLSSVPPTMTSVESSTVEPISTGSATTVRLPLNACLDHNGRIRYVGRQWKYRNVIYKCIRISRSSAAIEPIKCEQTFVIRKAKKIVVKKIHVKVNHVKKGNDGMHYWCRNVTDSDNAMVVFSSEQLSVLSGGKITCENGKSLKQNWEEMDKVKKCTLIRGFPVEVEIACLTPDGKSIGAGRRRRIKKITYNCREIDEFRLQLIAEGN